MLKNDGFLPVCCLLLLFLIHLELLSIEKQMCKPINMPNMITYTYAYVCVCVCIYLFQVSHMCVCVYTCARYHVCVCVCVCVCIHVPGILKSTCNLWLCCAREDNYVGGKENASHFPTQCHCSLHSQVKILLV